MRSLISATGAVWLAFVGAAFAQVASFKDISVDYEACQAQLKALLRLDMDCTITAKVGNGSLEFVPAALRPLLRSLACSLPIQFPKKDVYDRWIRLGVVEVPAMRATCRISVAGKEASEFSASLELRCEKGADAWSCIPKMHSATALGVIGTQLENFVNTNLELRKQIGQTLAPFGQ